ncbi:Calx-beta domain-containing protein [Aliiglaciecola sp. LCG003]|uniref:Calx-beta domain-containing protein n=1 Tax=Aliiglaciecola sp. LCG003 TaxID=3053655 RepID=UPI002573A790|nr:Calx-beta domain-containing protein [Aliiglaciecola sp. LCG003]WJG08747.1 Calx-beta domain-containing protein [Aliiglaciecola sp. LCG003]
MKKFIYSLLIPLAALSTDLYANTTNSNSSSVMAESTPTPILSFPNFEANTKQVKTNIVFFYTDAALSRLGGIDKLNDYINLAVENANLYTSTNNISLERSISAVIPYPEELDESKISIAEAALYVRENLASLTQEYNATYYAVIVGSIPDNVVGIASQGGSVSYFTPNYLDGIEYSTLGHMLGHNDGLVHEVTGNEGYDTMGGSDCGTVSSLMSPQVRNRTEYLLSSPQTMNNLTAENCGDPDTADVRSYYFNAVENDLFINAQGPFSNYVAPIASSGQITYSLAADSFDENSGSISVMVNWAEVSDPASFVELYVRPLTADENDYQFENQRIALTTASGSEVYEITLTDDNEIEEVESIEVGFRYPVGVSIGSEPREIFIVSEDSLYKGDVTISGNIVITEGQSKTLTLERTGGANGELRISFTAYNDTATNSDYTISEPQFVFSDGERTKDVVITAIDDSIDENDEAFSISISSTDKDSTVSGSVEITIVDNDDTPPASVKLPESSGSGGGSMGISAFLLGLVALLRRQKNSHSAVH